MVMCSIRLRRKAAKLRWPQDIYNRMRPAPEYDWRQYNPDDVGEVDPSFEPEADDILLKFVRDKEKIRKSQNPQLVGNTYNPHWDVTPVLEMYQRQEGVGDYLIRAGYESNGDNPNWTNATVEVYQMEERPDGRMCWRFKGRDMYIFGTEYIQGGLAGVQRSGIAGIRVADIPPMLDNPDRPVLGHRISVTWRPS